MACVVPRKKAIIKAYSVKFRLYQLIQQLVYQKPISLGGNISLTNRRTPKRRRQQQQQQPQRPQRPQLNVRQCAVLQECRQFQLIRLPIYQQPISPGGNVSLSIQHRRQRQLHLLPRLLKQFSPNRHQLNPFSIKASSVAVWDLKKFSASTNKVALWAERMPSAIPGHSRFVYKIQIESSNELKWFNFVYLLHFFIRLRCWTTDASFVAVHLWMPRTF